MAPPKAARWLFLAVGIVLAVTGCFLASGSLPGAHSGEDSNSGGSARSGAAEAEDQATVHRDRAEAGVPSRIEIPRLHVSAPVQGISMSNDPASKKYRTLVPPSDPATVGWWQDGPIPGAGVGSSLIVGHTLKRQGVEGVGGGALGYAARLRQGDDVDVYTNRGVVRYEVTRVVPDKAFEQVAEEAKAIDDRHFPGGRLVLITCWYDGSRFTGNTFVFAQPV
ncbi:class F sortase [Actinopolymorpha sp. B11F2]|uniref:class F sortase n=1 Tax=Actinopolymorpha sp. B11F2 TaxID=3160862 RepID=UPI0032E3F7D6